MCGDLVEHMVEKGDAGVDLPRRVAVEIDGDGDPRLLGVADDLAPARRPGGRVGHAERRERRLILRLGADREANPAGRGIGPEADADAERPSFVRQRRRLLDFEEQEIAAAVADRT